MIYDFEILVPAETDRPEIYQRLLDFKRHGLINYHNNKIRLIFTCSPNNNADFLTQDWPDNVKVDILHTPFKQVSQRICHYYAHYIKPDTAKWYLRIDEDSITDIDGLSYHLNLKYDHTREYHLTTHFLTDLPAMEAAVLKTLGLQYLVDDPPAHEHESSITSQAAISRVCNSPLAKKYFRIREQVPDGWGDVVLAIGLAIEKIYGKQINFTTKDAKIFELTCFGGHLCHIHNVTRKNFPEFYQFLDEKLTSTNYSNNLETDKKYLLLSKKTKKGAAITAKSNYNLVDIDNKPIGLYCNNFQNKLVVLIDRYPIQFLEKIGSMYENELLTIEPI